MLYQVLSGFRKQGEVGTAVGLQSCVKSSLSFLGGV